jgi:hypothetical protein
LEISLVGPGCILGRSLHRVTDFERGDLNANKDAITGTPVREQAWTLQDIGNWTDFDTKDSDGDYIRPYEDRTHNTTNEITRDRSLGHQRRRSRLL